MFPLPEKKIAIKIVVEIESSLIAREKASVHRIPHNWYSGVIVFDPDFDQEDPAVEQNQDENLSLVLDDFHHPSLNLTLSNIPNLRYCGVQIMHVARYVKLAQMNFNTEYFYGKLECGNFFSPYRERSKRKATALICTRYCVFEFGGVFFL